jgi:hypothetical protein
MGLEDSVAKYEIQITRTGDGASVAAQEFKNLDDASKKVSSSVGASNESLKQLRETSLLTREGMHELNSMALLAGGSRFPQLTEATIAARMGLMSVRTAAMLTGQSLEVVAPIIGVIAVAAGAGLLAWKSYRDEMQQTEDQAKRMTAALKDLPVMVNQIAGLEKAGLVNQGQSQEWYRLMGASATPMNPAETPYAKQLLSAPGMNNPGYAEWAAKQIAAQGQVRPDNMKAIQEEMAGQGLLLKNGENYEVNPQIEALEKLKDLRDKITQSTLDGYDKEREEVKVRYSEEMAQINALSAIAGSKYTEDQQRSLQLAAGQAANHTLALIAGKEDAEMAKRAAEAAKQAHQMVLDQQRQADEELKAEQQARQQESLDMIKQFNQEEKLYTLTSKDDKKTILDTELKDRLDFDANMMLDYRITLDQMAEMDNEARIKYQEGLNSIEKGEQLHVMTVHQMELHAAEEFASGFADAFVSFVQGTKSAEQAFGEFAASFVADVGKMIMEQEILNAINASGLLGGGGIKTASTGGIFPIMAASGLSGVSSVSSPTYFPKFNVVAGEAGREMLTVLSRPRMMDIGGMQAVIGKAGNNTLAITNASDLANKSGPNGTITVELRPAPGYEAGIVQTAIQGAVVKVTSDMGQHTPLRQAVKQATA